MHSPSSTPESTSWAPASSVHENLDEALRDVVRLNVDAIVTWAMVAAKRTTSTIPIVFVAARVPIERGIVLSLARPGGNTGVRVSLGFPALPGAVSVVIGR